MKNETARREIESLDYYLQNHTDDYSEESHTAMMMAVKALEQEPCEDAISRQAVLDLVVANHTELNGVNVVMYSPLCKDIKQLPPDTPQPKTGHWIPVSERLPYNHEYIQNNGLFNVSDGNRSYSEWFDIYDTQKFGEPTMSGFRVDYAVTAWMPLPTPYEPRERSGEE